MKFLKVICILIIWISIWLFASYFFSDNFQLYSSVYGENLFLVDSNLYKYSRFEEINKILDSKYYDYNGLDTDLMIEDAVKAYVDGIWDPYTVYMDAETNSGFMSSLEWENNFEWIGAVVSKKDYYVLIEQVIKDTPAYKAWLQPLDRIVQVDWEYVQDESLDESTNRMKWPKWSSVLLKIERVDENGESNVFEVSVIRDEINVPSLSTQVFDVDNKKIWYLEISMVWEETENILRKEIPELKNETLGGMIVDLRWNGWWLMDVAVQIVSHFIPKWELVVKSKYAWFADEIYTSKWYWDFEWMKVIVLIDWLTASAGEIMALALQEQVNATILWTKSFGKGTIQTLHEFDDGASLKYTIWKWFPPSGICIDKIWITPDIVVEFDATWYINDEVDNQLEEAKNLFK